MGDVVNLNRFRKQKAREEKEARAEENRVRFGRTRAEREKARREDEQASRTLEAHRREGDDDASGSGDNDGKSPA